MSLFISETEKLIAEEFQRQGYIIRPVADNALERIQALTTETAADFLGSTFEDPETFLNQIHEQIDAAKLNLLRIHVIRQMNAQAWFRGSYFQLAKLALEMLVGNELAMQLRINLSIQLPQDASSLLPVHADVWSGDSPYEVVVWLPLVDCYSTKAMYLLPPSVDKQLREEFGQWAGRSSEELFRRIEKRSHLDRDQGR